MDLLTRADLLARIHQGVDPFAGAAEEDWITDPWDGWESTHIWFEQAIVELRPRVIVEVGTFLGGSAIHMAKLLRWQGLDACVVCVDTWLAEKTLWLNPEWRPHLRHRYGRPEFYRSFMANVLAAGVQSYIIPLSMDSAGAGRFLAQVGISAEMIYIDGSHEAGEVYRDLALYYDNVLSPGGYLIADDYDPEFPGLIADVHRFEEERGRTFAHHGRKLRMIK